MAKQPISQKRAQRQQQENKALQQVFNVFLLGLAAECFMFIVYRNIVLGNVEQFLTWSAILEVLMVVGLVALAAGAVLFLTKKNCGKARQVALWIAGVGLFLAVSGAFSSLAGSRGVTVMCIAIPILTLLGLVFYLFQPECFVSAVALVTALFSVWVSGHGRSLYAVAGAVLALALLAVLALVSNQARKSNGMVKDRRLYAANANYKVLFSVLGAAAVGVAAALISGAIAYYLMWVLGVLLFAAMVYYTTKLM